MAEISTELRDSFANAPFPRLMGFRLLDLSEGYARVAITLRPEHANFLGGVDGALITALADCAHAIACNTSGRVRVGLQSNINYVSALSLKGELIAEARVVHSGRTIALTDVAVTDSSGKVIAMSTSTSFSRQS